MPSYYCRDCDIAWPTDTKHYTRCPRCRNATSYDFSRSAMGADLAGRHRRAYDFEHYYENRERDREKKGDPTPEYEGAMEARNEMRQLKALEKAFQQTKEE